MNCSHLPPILILLKFKRNNKNRDRIISFFILKVKKSKKGKLIIKNFFFFLSLANFANED